MKPVWLRWTNVIWSLKTEYTRVLCTLHMIWADGANKVTLHAHMRTWGHPSTEPRWRSSPWAFQLLCASIQMLSHFMTCSKQMNYNNNKRTRQSSDWIENNKTQNTQLNQQFGVHGNWRARLNPNRINWYAETIEMVSDSGRERRCGGDGASCGHSHSCDEEVTETQNDVRALHKFIAANYC